jgi:triosephosphate isomerase
MDRKMLVAGNWKMYTTSGEGAVLIQDLADRVREVWDEVEVAVCPPFTGLKAASTVIELDKLTIALGAQDMHWEAEGAFTGAIAPRMLTELRCDYVIIGHSERREFFGETNETVNRKVQAAFAAGLVPIMCCGESLAVRDALETESFVRKQVLEGAAGLDAAEAAKLVIAYEPIWAIGTGRTPTPEAANDVCRTIRATVGAMYGPPAAMAVRVLYGGSVKAENAKMFFAEPDIDGGLVGGAALKADSFADIVKAAL